jgi:hypothetical protein
MPKLSKIFVEILSPAHEKFEQQKTVLKSYTIIILHMLIAYYYCYYNVITGRERDRERENKIVEALSMPLALQVSILGLFSKLKEHLGMEPETFE